MRVLVRSFWVGIRGFALSRLHIIATYQCALLLTDVFGSGGYDSLTGTTTYFLENKSTFEVHFLTFS